MSYKGVEDWLIAHYASFCVVDASKWDPWRLRKEQGKTQIEVKQKSERREQNGAKGTMGVVKGSRSCASQQ
jgi:hypothetical protein